MATPTDPRLSFDAAADLYDQIRPTYPPELFDDLFDMLPNSPRIVEVGPGTGQATRDLLARGASVEAIEIGPALARKLRANLDSENLKVHVGDFEEVPTGSAKFDAVFSATAYHWISPTAQLDRPAAVLRQGGVVAIVDLNQVDSPDDGGFFDAVQPIYDRHGQGHIGPPAPTRDSVRPRMLQPLESDVRFSAPALRAYDWNQPYSASEYRTLMLSYSGTQMMEPQPRLALLDEIESFIHHEFDGNVIRPIVVTLTTATLS